jgi:hypothetical protein
LTRDCSAVGANSVKGGFDRVTGAVLAGLFRPRGQADHALIEVPAEEAARAVTDDERFVAAVEEWIAGRR